MLSHLDQDIAIPALAYPVKLATRGKLDVTTEKTRINLVCAAIGIDSPSTIPVQVLPIEMIPLKAGLKMTCVPAIGTNKLDPDASDSKI